MTAFVENLGELTEQGQLKELKDNSVLFGMSASAAYGVYKSVQVLKNIFTATFRDPLQALANAQGLAERTIDFLGGNPYALPIQVLNRLARQTLSFLTSKAAIPVGAYAIFQSLYRPICGNYEANLPQSDGPASFFDRILFSHNKERVKYDLIVDRDLNPRAGSIQKEVCLPTMLFPSAVSKVTGEFFARAYQPISKIDLTTNGFTDHLKMATLGTQVIAWAASIAIFAMPMSVLVHRNYFDLKAMSALINLQTIGWGTAIIAAKLANDFFNFFCSPCLPVLKATSKEPTDFDDKIRYFYRLESERLYPLKRRSIESYFPCNMETPPMLSSESLSEYSAHASCQLSQFRSAKIEGESLSPAEIEKNTHIYDRAALENYLFVRYTQKPQLFYHDHYQNEGANHCLPIDLYSSNFFELKKSMGPRFEKMRHYVNDKCR